jgi:hypothetical protein
MLTFFLGYDNGYKRVLLLESQKQPKHPEPGRTPTLHWTDPGPASWCTKNKNKNKKPGIRKKMSDGGGRDRSESVDRDREGGRDRGGERDRDDGRGGDRERGGERTSGTTCSLLVRNISYRVRADELKEVFGRYGEVRDVYIPQVNLSFIFLEGH